MVEISVPDIRCQGCYNKILSALAQQGIHATADARFKIVTVEAKDEKAAREVIIDAGYKPE